MFNKSFLVREIVDTLAEKEFELFLSEGCFDVAARKDFLMLIKALVNVDGLLKIQAKSLRIISYFTSAYPLIVSLKSNRGFLEDDVIYSRFNLPVVTLKMFKRLVWEEFIPFIKTTRGKHTVVIDTRILRERRKEMRLSLEKLSRKVGISKKALYEIEKGEVEPMRETVERLEEVLGVDLKKPYRLRIPEKKEYLKTKDAFQRKVSEEFKRIGIDNSPVKSAPFEIIGKEKISLITALSFNMEKAKMIAPKVKNLSSIFSSESIFVLKKSEERVINGIPIILESELPELETPKELRKLMEEKKE